VHLLYCDETNLAEKLGDFLIYGGIVIDSSKAKEFSIAIDALRQRYNVPNDYLLKFNPGPKNLDHEQFIALKQELLELSAKFEVRLLVYVILHDIAKSSDLARRNGINTVCYHFDCVLNRLGVAGLVLIDRFNDGGNAIDGHLREKFMVGVTGLPFSDEKRLSNIIPHFPSSLTFSHL
jgi:hypothetical protein